MSSMLPSVTSQRALISASRGTFAAKKRKIEVRGETVKILYPKGLIITMIVIMLGMHVCASAPYAYNEIVPCSVPRGEEHKVGYLLRSTGQWVIHPKFDWAREFTCENVARVKMGEKWGIIDINGNFLVEPQYDTIDDFYDGLAEVERNGKFGFIDTTGKEVIPAQFDSVGPFSEGLAQVEVNGEVGFINKSGKFVISLQYDDAYRFRGGFALVMVKDKWGCINKQGQMVIKPRFSGGEVTGGWAFDDRQKNTTESPFYDLIGCFSEGLVPVLIDGKWGYVDETGKIVIAPQFDWTVRFSEGLAVVRAEKEFVFIDKTGRIVIRHRWSFARNFAEGRAAIEVDDKWGFIDKTGMVVIIPQFDRIVSFYNGMAAVQMNGKWGYIDRDGQWLTDPFFESDCMYWPAQGIVESDGYYYDKHGHKLDHYVNHLLDGINYGNAGEFSAAIAEFEAALRINPQDETALDLLRRARARYEASADSPDQCWRVDAKMLGIKYRNWEKIS